MQQVPPSQFETPRSANPLRTAAIVIYGTLALLAVTIPQSLSNWLSDMNSNRPQEVALRGAEALRTLSERAGVAAVYQRARAVFIAISGIEPD
jgi:hypothetical protein